jgi:hypothetical protein
VAGVVGGGDVGYLYGLLPISFQIKMAPQIEEVIPKFKEALDSGQPMLVELGGRLWLGMGAERVRPGCSGGPQCCAENQEPSLCSL